MHPMIAHVIAEASPHASLWQQYLSTQFAPDHLFSELGFSIVFEVLQFVGLALLWRKVIKPRFAKQIHDEIDSEHGVEHQESAHDLRADVDRDDDGAGPTSAAA